MARIKGVDIPNDKHICISLTYIYGIGRSLARQIFGFPHVLQWITFSAELNVL